MSGRGRFPATIGVRVMEDALVMSGSHTINGDSHSKTIQKHIPMTTLFFVLLILAFLGLVGFAVRSLMHGDQDRQPATAASDRFRSTTKGG